MILVHTDYVYLSSIQYKGPSVLMVKDYHKNIINVHHYVHK